MGRMTRQDRPRFDAGKETAALGLPRSFADVLESCELYLDEQAFGRLLEGLRMLRAQVDVLRAQVDESALFGEIGATGGRETLTTAELAPALVGGLDLGDLVRALLIAKDSKVTQAVGAIVHDRITRLQGAMAAMRPPVDDFERDLFALIREELLPVALCRRPSLSRAEFQAALGGWRSRGPKAVGFDPALIEHAAQAIAEEHPDWSREAVQAHLAKLLKVSSRTVRSSSGNNP